MSKSLSEHILGLQEISFRLVPGCQGLGLFGLHVFLSEEEIGTELGSDVFNEFLDGASTTHDSIKGVQAFVDGVHCRSQFEICFFKPSRTKDKHESPSMHRFVFGRRPGNRCHG